MIFIERLLLVPRVIQLVFSSVSYDIAEKRYDYHKERVDNKRIQDSEGYLHQEYKEHKVVSRRLSLSLYRVFVNLNKLENQQA